MVNILIRLQRRRLELHPSLPHNSSVPMFHPRPWLYGFLSSSSLFSPPLIRLLTKSEKSIVSPQATQFGANHNGQRSLFIIIPTAHSVLQQLVWDQPFSLLGRTWGCPSDLSFLRHKIDVWTIGSHSSPCTTPLRDHLIVSSDSLTHRAWHTNHPDNLKPANLVPLSLFDTAVSRHLI
ncbi:hypothetical protein EX30DRAFT_240624 [Ascodesmis nigricans]|uniref:Uncharacterized protein n=1 Tax=Ascodesmis nigricans TaxID=341454 RepID=A0A4S2MYV3_9PEZI|nr:hypothetical protein EX30DRAFT_240624 [Ascodesmis nigricans]